MLNAEFMASLIVILSLAVSRTIITNAQDFADMAANARNDAEQLEDGNQTDTSSQSYGQSALEFLYIAHGNRRLTGERARAGRVFQTASIMFFESAQMSMDELRTTDNATKAFQTAMTNMCDPLPVCNSSSKFRTADGSCNNLEHPYWGQSFTAQRRDLTPVYSDGVNAPRVNGTDGQPLPSARTVSRTVHRSSTTSPRDKRFTLMVMQWGQFLDHDFIITPVEEVPTNVTDPCCGEPTREGCFPIEIEQPDPYFNNTCMEFIRSAPALDRECMPSIRQQINSLTSYIDASMVYGSTKEEQLTLRTDNGKLNISEENLLPEDTRPNICRLTPETNDYCPLAGEERVVEQPLLTIMHTIFVREHNRIAETLKGLNPTWNSDRIFEETRKIVGAEIQHITYKEFLPIIIGNYKIKQFKLKPARRGLKNVYNEKVDATTGNGFVAAVWRFGHSTVPDAVKSLNSTFDETATLPLEQGFGNPNFHFSHHDGMARYLVGRPAFKVDRKVERSVHDLLFLDDAGASFDLPALNIQRGRDHGIPPYSSWRKWCKLPVPTKWTTYRKGFRHHTLNSVKLLQSVYRNPGDVDLFTGGLTEKPVYGGIVGPTFACVIARQFRRFKVGDRFYYENPSKLTGFSSKQVNEIKKTTLSRILCDNTNITKIQPSAFKPRSKWYNVFSMVLKVAALVCHVARGGGVDSGATLIERLEELFFLAKNRSEQMERN